MPTFLLLALPDPDTGIVPALCDLGGETAVGRLARQFSAYGEVGVVTVEWLEQEVKAGLSPGARVMGVDHHADVLRCVVEPPDGDVLAVDGGIVTGDVAVARLVLLTRGVTAALIGPADDRQAVGNLVGVAYGRVVGSVDSLGPAGTRTLAGALALTPTARNQVRQGLAESPEQASAGAPVASGTQALQSLLRKLLTTAVPVSAAQLPRGLPWYRLQACSEAMRAREATEEADEEQVLLEAAVKSDDGFFATFFVSSYSRYWARWCARHRITPNQVTVASMAVGLMAAASFGAGTRPLAIVGAVLLQLAFTLDCVDGQLARYTGAFSTFGSWLDAMFDRAKEYAVYAGLAIGGIRAGGDANLLWGLATAALLLQVARHALDFGYAARQQDDLDAAGAMPPGGAGVGTPDPGPRPGSVSETRARIGGGARDVVSALRRAEEVPALKWAKRIVVLPIGERFLLISVLAVSTTPRGVFLALLAWGGAAFAYTFGGRLVRSFT
jgi:phosphatidylglycerophosphate synthase